MELILNRHRSIFEVFSKWVHQKGENIRFEQVLTPGEPIDSAISKIQHELMGIDSDATRLTIIDPYFLNVEEKKQTAYIEHLMEIIGEINVNRIVIYSNLNYKRKCQNHCKIKAEYEEKTGKKFCFSYTDKSGLAEEIRKSLSDSGKSVEINKLRTKIHDRLWIFNNGNGMMIGTSFNGIGTALCLVSPIQPSDMAQLIDFLNKSDIDTQSK